MRKAATVVVATSLVVMVFAGIQPSGGQDPEGAEAIGVYHRLGSDNDLTSEHVSWNGEALEVEGPAFTEKLEIEQTYLEAELGAWGSFQEFSVDKGIVQIDHAKAAFEAFTLSEEPIFTQGAGDQVKLLERPMWLNASQEAHGEQITLTLEDGDSSGQQIFISRDWLWERGIQWFNVTHEDGSLLPVTEQSGGVMVDVPHFSELNINPDELDVKQVVGGVPVENLGETRWLWQESVLEVDVDNNPSGDYEVLISADWLDLHIRPETFNVYSSKELVDPDPDTGIQVCCGGGGSSQDYYSVKFSTSGSSVMIEVIGEHLPVYTVQDGDLAPHWGQKDWNETLSVLEVEVGEQSSDYEVWVEKEWVDVNIEFPGLEDYKWTVLNHDGIDYYNVYLASSETSTTINFTMFHPNETPTFTLGNSNSLWNWIWDNNTNQSAAFSVSMVGNMSFQLDHPDPFVLAINRSWLDAQGISHPNVTNENLERLGALLTPDNNTWTIPIKNTTSTVHILEQTESYNYTIDDIDVYLRDGENLTHVSQLSESGDTTDVSSYTWTWKKLFNQEGPRVEYKPNYIVRSSQEGWPDRFMFFTWRSASYQYPPGILVMGSSYWGFCDHDDRDDSQWIIMLGEHEYRTSFGEGLFIFFPLLQYVANTGTWVASGDCNPTDSPVADITTDYMWTCTNFSYCTNKYEIRTENEGRLKQD